MKLNIRESLTIALIYTVGILVFGVSHTALAAAIPVTTIEDETIANGKCSLREAIRAASSLSE